MIGAHNEKLYHTSAEVCNTSQRCIIFSLHFVTAPIRCICHPDASLCSISLYLTRRQPRDAQSHRADGWKFPLAPTLQSAFSGWKSRSIIPAYACVQDHPASTAGCVLRYSPSQGHSVHRVYKSDKTTAEKRQEGIWSRVLGPDEALERRIRAPSQYIRTSV